MKKDKNNQSMLLKMHLFLRLEKKFKVRLEQYTWDTQKIHFVIKFKYTYNTNKSTSIVTKIYDLQLVDSLYSNL